MKKTLSIFLILTFLSGPGYALAPSLVSDPGINPGRSAQLQGDIATKLEPGAIGNGAPLAELAQGKLPSRASLAPNEYQELAQKLREAIAFAMKAGAENEKEVPPEHAARAQQALVNLLLLQYNLSSNAYLFSADVRGPEDYLLGFNRGSDRGYAIELIRILPVSRLAQYIYHECVPESGIINDRDDHRVVYNEIQSAVFGKDEVAALKKDLRDFINRRTAAGLVGPRIVVAPKSALVAGKIAIRPGLSPAKSSYMKRWFSAHRYASRFKVIDRDSRKTIRTFFGKFDIQQQTELFDLINKAFPGEIRVYGAYGIFSLLLYKYSTDLDQIKHDLEFCMKARQNFHIFQTLPRMRQNITDAGMQKIWFDLAFRLASTGVFLKDIMERGSEIAKVCKTSQDLGIVADLVNETSQRLTNEGKAAVQKEARSSYEVDLGRLLAETLVASKNVEDLAINLKYLEIIGARFFQEPERTRADSSFFSTASVYIDKLISEARRFNAQGQGFDISIKRGRYTYPTDENGNTYEAYDELEKVEIIPGSIKVPYIAIAGLPAKVHVTPRQGLDEKMTDTGNTRLLGAIGNGAPLTELAEGKLPSKLTLADKEYQEIAKKLTNAIDLAVRFAIIREDMLPLHHKARAKQTLGNLMILLNNVSRDVYLFNADIRSPEDYLIGFNKQNYRGFAVELVRSLPPKHLAQYIYHECVPEEGDIAKRDDHRAIYNEIQSVIFGLDEVVALKMDLRRFINKRSAQSLMDIQEDSTQRIGNWQLNYNLWKLKHAKSGNAQEVLIKAGAKAVPGLIKALEDKNHKAYWVVRATLTKIGAIAVPYLIEELRKNPSDSIIYILGEAGDRRAIGPLLECLEKNKSEVLGALGKIVPSTPEVVVALITMSGGKYEREHAERILNKIKTSIGAAEPFIKALSNKDYNIRVTVARHLKDIKDSRLEPLNDYLLTPSVPLTLDQVDLVLNCIKSGNKFFVELSRGTEQVLVPAITHEEVIPAEGYYVDDYTQDGVDRMKGWVGTFTGSRTWVETKPGRRYTVTDLPKHYEAIVTGVRIVEKSPTSQISDNLPMYAQTSEALPLYAKIFAANLAQILSQHPDQLFFMGIETDIGLDQKAQIMPIYKAIDQIKEMKNSDGKPFFPNLMVKRGKAADLVTEVASLKEDGKLALNNTFIGARKLSVDNRLYDSIKGEGNAWIAAIDDSRPGDYLPVFESITLSMMAYLNAEVAAIKNFYDAISDKPIDPAVLQDMVRNRIIYILPRSTKFDIKQLRDLYELAQQLHTAA
jgi:hypothetical protein